jgi:aspartyl-tRNA(Asn)/glutamyl-tRNA(Gln) amidotransferase subunit A
VSLWEGSALIALGSDTGGSIRIPASVTGTVGLRTTKGRWPTEGVVPLSPTLDVVGALTRSVEDARYVFEAVEGAKRTSSAAAAPAVRVGIPRCAAWREGQGDIVEVLEEALSSLASAGWVRVDVEGSLLDEASRSYLGGAIVGAECLHTLEMDLPGWRELLHPIVATRLEGAPTYSSPAYAEALKERRRLEERAGVLFDSCDVLAMPTAVTTPPAVDTLADAERYAAANRASLAPTCPASVLGLCALTLPVGLDRAGMPVGLQLIAPSGADEMLLSVAEAAERTLGTLRDQVGRPPLLPA